MSTATPLDATPIAEGLFTWPSDSPALIGTRCGSCGEVTFPSHYGCPRCASEDMVPFELSTTGTVWTWTSQNFRPPAPYAGPEEFTPYEAGEECGTYSFRPVSSTAAGEAS